jgi:hypothetical protein
MRTTKPAISPEARTTACPWSDVNGSSRRFFCPCTLTALKRDHGVPEALQGCYTLLIEGYVVEGHVPVAQVKRILAERPAIKGLSLPGMDSEKTEPFAVYEIGDGDTEVFARE